MAVYTEEGYKTEVRAQWARIILDVPKWSDLHPSKKLSVKNYAIAKEANIHNAWKVYSNALSSQLREMLLGDVKLRSDLVILENFGTTAGNTTTMSTGTLRTEGGVNVTEEMVKSSIIKQNILVAEARSEAAHDGEAIRDLITPTDGSDLLYKGSVLNDGTWWPLINDAWVLGAVHGLKVFQLTLATIPLDLLWDKKFNRPRVLGRELIGLKAAGYALIGLPSWGAPKSATPLGASELSTASVSATVAIMAEVRAALGFTFAPTTKTAALGLTITSYLTAIGKYKSKVAIKDAVLSGGISYNDYDYTDRISR